MEKKILGSRLEMLLKAMVRGLRRKRCDCLLGHSTVYALGPWTHLRTCHKISNRLFPVVQNQMVDLIIFFGFFVFGIFCVLDDIQIKQLVFGIILCSQYDAPLHITDHDLDLLNAAINIY
jgi:hypothetical protein